MLERILLAVDESEHARKAVPAAIELARAGGGMVQVLHVRELEYAPATVVGGSREEAERLVVGVVEELKQAGVTAEGSVRTSTGGPARAILEAARDLDATMIVLGSPGAVGPRRTAARQRRAQDHPTGLLPGPGGPRRAEPRRATLRRAQSADQVPGLSWRAGGLVAL
jgi:nucleotide-binding universal stress UspA family protein